MKIHKKPLILLVLILVLLQVVVTAQVAAGDDDEVSDQEKRELIAFSKRFIGRMQKTRDVAPLMKEFFLPASDLSAFLGRIEDDEGGYTPDLSQAKRLVAVTTNYFYLVSVAQIVGGDDYRFNLHSILPKRLGSQLDKEYDTLLDSMEEADGRRFRRLLPRVEGSLKAARRHLTQKNYENTPKYRAVVAEREKEEFYNYDITRELQCESDDKDSLACFLQRFGPDTRSYLVGMPHGLGPIVVKLKSGYKILMIFPHPMSG